MQTIDEARKIHREASTKRSRLYGKPGYAEALAEQKAIEERAWALFGDTVKVEDRECPSCRVYSIFGGPSHTASPRCQSGRHPHCTCDTCW